jgi:hypothetical protein
LGENIKNIARSKSPILAWRRGAEDVAIPQEREGPGSNPARVQGFQETKAVLLRNKGATKIFETEKNRPILMRSRIQS